MRRLAALTAFVGTSVIMTAVPLARAQSADPGVDALATASQIDDSFELTSSDLTGPIAVPPGQGIWRSVAVRNTSSEYRLTIGLTGSGETAAWVVPALDQIELAPGQQQIVKVTVKAPPTATGAHEVRIVATLLEAKTVVLVGESPVVTAQRRELAFRIDVAAPGVAIDNETDTTISDSDAGLADAGESLTGGGDLDVGRVANGLAVVALAVLALYAVAQLGRKGRRFAFAHRAAGDALGRDRARPTRPTRRRSTGDRELFDEARRAATSVLTQRAARARERAESEAIAAASVQSDAVRARDHSLARLADERLAVESSRQLAHRVESDDRASAARVRVEARVRAKQARRDLARHQSRAQLEAARDAEVDRQTFAELSRAAWLQARTSGARARMQRDALELSGPTEGSAPLAFEDAIVERPVPPRPVTSDQPDLIDEPGVVDLPAAPPRPDGARRTPRPTKKIDIVALDVNALNHALEARRARDAFDDRANRLSGRS